MAALKRLREEAGLSLDQAAELTGFSRAKIGNIETLKGKLNGDDTKTLCQAYGADPEETDALAELAYRSNQRGWWHVYSDNVLGRVADLVELEADADEIRAFTLDLIPGLLQTEGYARALIGAAFKDSDDGRVRLRMERQRRAWDRGVKVWAIIGESALRHRIGGISTMAAQLDHLANLAEGPHVTVQVLPIDHREHAAMGVPFALIRLSDGTTFGYLDTLAGGIYLEAPDVDLYRATWARLPASAVEFATSIETIRRIADEFKGSSE